ncbi:MAG TPA: hypothetical protein VF635_09325 [Propionibacteriaceae bacterium]
MLGLTVLGGLVARWGPAVTVVGPLRSRTMPALASITSGRHVG